MEANQSNEQSAAAASNEQANVSFEQQVNDVVSKMVQDSNGNWQLPKMELAEEVKFAANAERRRRSAQSALSKEKLQLKASKATIDKLKKKIASSTQIQLSQDDLDVLEDLKATDPDEWYRQRSKLEAGANANLQSEFDSIDREASQQAVLEARQSILEEYNRTHPDAQLSDEVVQNNLPPIIVDRLAKGEVSFEEFLIAANKYLTGSKVVGGGTTIDPTPNLGEAGGGSVPSEHTKPKDDTVPYSKTVF